MSINRRSLLKLFGAGATIAPVVAGVPALDTQAVIIAPPTVELAPPLQVVPVSSIPPLTGDVNGCDVVLYFRDRVMRTQYRMDCTAVITDWEREMVDVTAFRDGRSQYIGGYNSVTFRATGAVNLVRTGGR